MEYNSLQKVTYLLPYKTNSNGYRVSQEKVTTLMCKTDNKFLIKSKIAVLKTLSFGINSYLCKKFHS